MKQRIPSLAVAGYILACIVFGGSSQNPWTNLGIQLAGILLISWAALAPVQIAESRRASVLIILLVCTLLFILFQLVPLPASVWTELPGREQLADGLAALGYAPSAFSISEMPSRSVLTLFAAIPAIAAFLATVRLAPSPRAIAFAIAAGMIAAVFLGALQVAGGPASWAYFYEVHSRGAIGFFANGNHMATLLLAGIPMAAALTVSAKSKRKMSAVARYGLGLAVFVLVIIGIILNGSRAAFALSIPVIVASAALFPAASRWRAPALGVSVLALLAGIAVVISNPIAAAELNTAEDAGFASRGAIWSVTTKAIADNLPVGTGLGTFETVYHRYENPAEVTRSYVNHAHNDYLEIVLELGAGGLIMIVAFLAWWLIESARIWISPLGTPFARAATIVTAATLVHSVVDFPLRTGAISAIFGACIGLMARHVRLAAEAQPGELRPTRHVKL